MTQPSVVFLNRVYPPGRGATGRVLRDLARGFARDGWNVTVITTGAEKGVSYDGAVRVVRVGAAVRPRGKAGYFFVWLKMFLRLLSLPRKDLVVTMTDPPLLVVAGRLAALFRRSRHIHWCQDLYPDLLPALGINLSPRWTSFLRRLSRRSMRKCDKVVVVGRCMARRLMHSGVRAGRITVIPNWPDYELLGPDGRKRMENCKLPVVHSVDGARPFEDQLHDGKGPKFRVLYSGNIGSAHPMKTILEAAAILHEDTPDVEFVFVGDGARFDAFAKERAKRGLDNIRFLPYQPASRLWKLMESGDLHLITMKDEAEGLLVPCKLYAALAVGRPCVLIGPGKSETATVIREFNAGSVVGHGQAEKLAKTIRMYRMSREAWFRAHEGASAAGQVFVPDEAVSAWLSRARDVIGKSGRLPQGGKKYRPKAANRNAAQRRPVSQGVHRRDRDGSAGQRQKRRTEVA